MNGSFVVLPVDAYVEDTNVVIGDGVGLDYSSQGPFIEEGLILFEQDYVPRL